MSVNQREKRNHGESRSSIRARLWRLAGPWWLLLLTGIAWLIVSVIVAVLGDVGRHRRGPQERATPLAAATQPPLAVADGQPVISSSSMTAMTACPRHAAATTASRWARVRTRPPSMTVLPLARATTWLLSGGTL